MANKRDDEWIQPNNPPPRLFFNQKERELVEKINTELEEHVIGQQVLYYPISLEHSNYHPLYGEAIDKTYLPPIRIFCLVDWEGAETKSDKGSIDRRTSITIHFHKKRLTAEQDLYVNEGDFVKYGEKYYEIVTLSEPKEIFGNTAYKIEISAKCIETREGVFNG